MTNEEVEQGKKGIGSTTKQCYWTWIEWMLLVAFAYAVFCR